MLGMCLMEGDTTIAAAPNTATDLPRKTLRESVVAPVWITSSPKHQHGPTQGRRLPQHPLFQEVQRTAGTLVLRAQVRLRPGNLTTV